MIDGASSAGPADTLRAWAASVRVQIDCIPRPPSYRASARVSNRMQMIMIAIRDHYDDDDGAAMPPADLGLGLRLRLDWLRAPLASSGAPFECGADCCFVPADDIGRRNGCLLCRPRCGRDPTDTSFVSEPRPLRSRPSRVYGAESSEEAGAERRAKTSQSVWRARVMCFMLRLVFASISMDASTGPRRARSHWLDFMINQAGVICVARAAGRGPFAIRGAVVVRAPK